MMVRASFMEAIFGAALQAAPKIASIKLALTIIACLHNIKILRM